MTESSEDVGLLKWLMIGGAVAAFSAAIAYSFEVYSASSTSRSAMENGYIQQLDEESGRVLWVKPNQPERQ